MRHKKRRGEWAEAAFVAKAMGQGLSVNEPCSEIEPYDFVVFNVRRAMNRGQVKSASSRWLGAYRATSSKYAFGRKDIDVLVVAVPEHDAWYVIPADACHGLKCLAFCPQNPRKAKRYKFEKYRETWHLLTGDEPGAWERYQTFTIHAQRE